MMSEGWISIEKKLPDSGQPITAQISYMGKITEVNGCRSKSEEKVVWFDFYSGTGAERIIKWKPRELPRKEDAHPWTGIANDGVD